MNKQYIERKISDIYYHRLFNYILLPSNIWKKSDDKSDEKESISKYCTLSSDKMSFVISCLCNEREKHFNCDYAVTGQMLCVIPHIREDAFKYTQNNHNMLPDS